jgi:hypothetical protein
MDLIEGLGFRMHLVPLAQVSEGVDDNAKNNVDQDRVNEDEKCRGVNNAEANKRPYVKPVSNSNTPHVLQSCVHACMRVCMRVPDACAAGEHKHVRAAIIARVCLAFNCALVTHTL